MSQYKYAEIADTVYFWFAANGTDGDAGDGATPLYDVRLAGAAADAAPTASGTPTLLTHVNYEDGSYEIAIDTTGYTAGEYAVFCTLTISAVNPSGFCGSFKLRTAATGALDVNTTHVSGTAQTANDNGADINTLITQVGTAGAGLTAITDKTDNLPSDPADASVIVAAFGAISDLIATAQADLNIITGTDGVTLATAQGNYAPAKVGDAMNLVADQSGATIGTVTTVGTVNALAADAVTEIITAIKASTGYSNDNTVSLANAIQILLAAVVGKMTDAGSNVSNFGDVDDDALVFSITTAGTPNWRIGSIA